MSRSIDDSKSLSAGRHRAPRGFNQRTHVHDSLHGSDTHPPRPAGSQRPMAATLRPR
jgi:hypothetical protein